MEGVKGTERETDLVFAVLLMRLQPEVRGRISLLPGLLNAWHRFWHFRAELTNLKTFVPFDGCLHKGKHETAVCLNFLKLLAVRDQPQIFWLLRRGIKCHSHHFL